jgi:hypothetical protein
MVPRTLFFKTLVSSRSTFYSSLSKMSLMNGNGNHHGDAWSLNDPLSVADPEVYQVNLMNLNFCRKYFIHCTKGPNFIQNLDKNDKLQTKLRFNRTRFYTDVNFNSDLIEPFFTLKFDDPGANPTISSYNASVVNFYNATGSLERFENKNIIFSF